MGATATGQPVTNLQIQSPSRSEIERGDLFVAALRDTTAANGISGSLGSNREIVYVYGRVMATDLLLGSIEGSLLIYLYADTGRRKVIPPIDVRLAANLLVPPILTNRLLWTRGYFETIGNVDIGEGEELERHCFKTVRGTFVDECSNPVADPPPMVGWHELASYRSVDEQISDALGIERAVP